MTGFGLCHVKSEGEACHPDGWSMEDGSPVPDDWYLDQLQAYAAWRGVEGTRKEGCERPHLLELLDGRG